MSGQAEDGYQPASVLIRPENRWAEDRAPITFKPSHLRGLAPAGRLDIDSTGLIVFTQDGRVARRLIGRDSEVEKEYLVRVEGTLSPAGMKQLQHGLELDGVQVEAGARVVAERASAALRAARRQEAPDPAHVRAGRARRHRT